MTEQEKNRDIAWVHANFDSFKAQVGDTDIIGGPVIEMVNRLESYTVKELFNVDMQGFDVSATPPTYNNFWIEADEEAEEEKKRHRRNILDEWKRYLDNLQCQSENEIALRDRLLKSLNALVPKNDAALAFDPAAFRLARAKAFSEIQRKTSSPNPTLERDTPPTAEAKPTPATRVEPAVGSPAYTHPHIANTLISLGTTFGLSYLYTSAAKAAICTAAGFVGISGLPVILIAGAGAGALIGTVTCITQNWDEIGQARRNATGLWNKAKAVTIATGRSIKLGHVFLHATTGLLGAGAGAALSGLFDCFTQLRAENIALGDSVAELNNQLTMQNSANLAITTEVDNLNEQIAGLNEQIETLKTEIADLKTQEAAIPAEPATFKITDIADAASSSSEASPVETLSVPDGEPVIDNDNVSASPENPSPVPGLELPQSSDVTVEPEPEVAATPESRLTPLNANVTVGAGDTLTDIVEKQYGIDELSALDSDQDGIRDFDEIMAAVANQNGLVGNEMNWLQRDWKLTMPSVDVADLSADLDRPSLDANWRAGDVVFSDAPQLKAA